MDFKLIIIKSGMIVGITGGIGGGKTTFSNLLRDMGFKVYDSDLEARRLQIEDNCVRTQMIELFGRNVYSGNSLNRSLVADVVFNNPGILQQLNAIIHPVVQSDFREWTLLYPNEKYLFIESAILFEAHFDKIVDKIILVTASEETRIDRVVKRDGLTKEQVKLRMKNQLSDEIKMKLSDVVVRTDRNEDLKVQLNDILNLL